MRFENGRLWVADKAWPVHPDDVRINDLTYGDGLPPFRFRGVRVRCENGWSVSIIWGTGTYSTNKWCDPDPDTFTDAPDHVEVAVFDVDETMYPDQPHGYVSDIELGELLDSIGSWPTRLGETNAWLHDRVGDTLDT